MKDFDLPLRKAYYECLNDKILVDAVAIPIIDTKLEERTNANDLYVMLASQNNDDYGVKCEYMMTSEMQLDIVQKWKGHGQATQRKMVDLIADKVLSTIFPEDLPRKFDHALKIDPAFALQGLKLRQTNTTSLLKTDEGWMQVKSLIFSQIIIQR